LAVVCKTIVELSGWTPFITKLEDTLGLDRYTANFAPMLAILFIGARMHALQIGPKLDSLQRWAQVCFYGCIASVFVQTLSAILIHFCVECECKEGPSEGELVFVMTNQTLAAVVNSIRRVSLFGHIGDFIALMILVSYLE